MDRVNRELRDRHAALAGSVDRLAGRQTFRPGRRLVQIYSGGAMPTGPDYFYLSHPVEVDGTEQEGSTGAAVTDTAQTIPVVVLGHAPSVGDILPAFGIGGRWVAERGGSGSPSFTCSPCAIPAQNLTISWVNPLAGNGSDTLVYSPVGPTWATGCSGGAGLGNPFLFKLYCTSGLIELRAYFFSSGSCPDGESDYCSNLRAQGSKLILSQYTCGSGFMMAFTVTALACPPIANSGFTGFTITL